MKAGKGHFRGGRDLNVPNYTLQWVPALLVRSHLPGMQVCDMYFLKTVLEHPMAT